MSIISFQITIFTWFYDSISTIWYNISCCDIFFTGWICRSFSIYYTWCMEFMSIFCVSIITCMCKCICVCCRPSCTISTIYHNWACSLTICSLTCKCHRSISIIIDRYCCSRWKKRFTSIILVSQVNYSIVTYFSISSLRRIFYTCCISYIIRNYTHTVIRTMLSW